MATCHIASWQQWEAYQPQTRLQVTTLLGVLDTASAQQHCHLRNHHSHPVSQPHTSLLLPS